jgi:hypothetical protein
MAVSVRDVERYRFQEANMAATPERASTFEAGVFVGYALGASKALL